MTRIHWTLFLILAWALAGCVAPTTPSVPAPVTSAPTATVAPTVEPTPTGAAEPSEVITTTETVDVPAQPAPAEATAPFDPATTTVRLQPVIEGLNQPLFVTHAADGTDRLFVIEKPGRILVYGPERSDGAIFLDIQDRVGSSGFEQGLLGLAFPPTFSESGHFFVNYTDRGGNTVVARFNVAADDTNAADSNSEFMVLTLAQPAANHNGGMVLFGPDGNLWIGTGDGGRANDAFGNAQDPQTLLGAMLRLDVTTDPSVPYTIPADNPWVTTDWQGRDVADEIWALGLRNPWRYSFDRDTGDLWIADVGQNQYEEINQVEISPGGLNFGWPILEGLHCFQSSTCSSEGMTMPVAEYDHSNGCSITGGYVYRGAQFPALNGVYFFGDYCTGLFWGHWTPADGDARLELLLRTGLQISSFGEDEAGELYLTDLMRGGVYRLEVAE